MKIKGILISLVLFTLVGLSLVVYFNHALSKEITLKQPLKEPLYFEIKPGQSLKSLAKQLQQQGLVLDHRLFYRYLQFTGKDKLIKKGVYQIPTTNSIQSLAELFSSGKTASIAVTLPEGRTSWEIYTLLKPWFALDSAVFDSLIDSPAFAKACGIEAPNLEGYLFPDTYYFPINAREHTILKIVTEHFLKQTKNISYNDSWVYQKYGFTGVLTLASIVEEEAAVAHEQKEIAGVFINRLKKGWPLGADPTVRFAIKKLTGPLYVSELQNNSPYNTRKFKGLPPGPISNPGVNAIRAVLNPAQTQNMFFVAKDDGSHEHFFAKTLGQHNQYKVVRKKNQSD